MTTNIMKEEIETRKLKIYASKIAKSFYDKNYSDLNFDELKQLLSIIDKYGSKYLQFYKFNDDKKTFISNLLDYKYDPIFDFTEEEKLEKVFIHKTSDNENFEIMFNFEVVDEVWVTINENQKEKRQIKRRKVLYLHNIKNYIVLAVDPVGIGRAVAGTDHLEKYKNQIVEILSNPLFDRITEINIEEAVKTLIKNQTFTARGITYEDGRTQRETKTICQNPNDNLKDIIVKLPENKNIQDLTLKYDKKTSLELFNKDLLKIVSRAQKDIHDDIKENIISVL
jgi:hypothetical protein